MMPGRPRTCSRATWNGGRTDNLTRRRTRLGATGRSPHGRIFLRRVVALGFVFGVLAILVGSAWAILGGGEGGRTAAEANRAAAEDAADHLSGGFTREQMATRIGGGQARSRRPSGTSSPGSRRLDTER